METLREQLKKDSLFDRNMCDFCTVGSSHCRECPYNGQAKDYDRRFREV